MCFKDYYFVHSVSQLMIEIMQIGIIRCKKFDNDIQPVENATFLCIIILIMF